MKIVGYQICLRITRFVIFVIRPDYQKFCLRSTPELCSMFEINDVVLYCIVLYRIVAYRIVAYCIVYIYDSFLFLLVSFLSSGLSSILSFIRIPPCIICPNHVFCLCLSTVNKHTLFSDPLQNRLIWHAFCPADSFVTPPKTHFLAVFCLFHHSAMSMFSHHTMRRSTSDRCIICNRCPHSYCAADARILRISCSETCTKIKLSNSKIC